MEGAMISGLMETGKSQSLDIEKSMKSLLAQ